MMRTAEEFNGSGRRHQEREEFYDSPEWGDASCDMPRSQHGHSRRERVPVLDARAMRGIAGDVVAAFAPNTEASPAAILIQFLVAFGSALGRGPYVAVGETRHHTNEYVLVVGTSARARKGDSKNAALRVIREADPDWRTQSGLSTGEGLVHAVRDPVVGRDRRSGEPTLGDPGVTDKRLSATESEFASVLKVMGKEGNTLSPVLRAGWDGDEVLGNLSKGARETATGAHISLIGHATPADLYRFLTNTDAANGFANRFAILLVERAQLLPNPRPTSPAVIAALADELRRVLQSGRQRGELHRTEAAQELWQRVYPDLSSDRPGLVGDLLARAEAHVLRFSLIYALLDESAAIDAAHIEAALALWDACEESVYTIFAGRTGNSDADRIMEAIEPGIAMTRSEIRDKVFSNHVPARRLTEAIRLIGAMPGWRIEEVDTDGRTAEILRHLAPNDEAEWPDEFDL